MQRSTLSSLALRSGDSFGVGFLAFFSASRTKRSAASPVNTGIDLIAVAMPLVRFYGSILLLWWQSYTLFA
jgi:hypothetical protein